MRLFSLIALIVFCTSCGDRCIEKNVPGTYIGSTYQAGDTIPVAEQDTFIVTYINEKKVSIQSQWMNTVTVDCRCGIKYGFRGNNEGDSINVFSKGNGIDITFSSGGQEYNFYGYKQ